MRNLKLLARVASTECRRSRQARNFQYSFEIYQILHSAYKRKKDPYWKDKVVSAFAAQVFLNLPQNKSILFSGLISKRAAESNSHVKEHRYPRKSWLTQRLFEPPAVTFEQFVSLYWTEGGTYHFTTATENRQLKSYYDTCHHVVLDGGERAYATCHIDLIPLQRQDTNK